MHRDKTRVECRERLFAYARRQCYLLVVVADSSLVSILWLQCRCFPRMHIMAGWRRHHERPQHHPGLCLVLSQIIHLRALPDIVKSPLQRLTATLGPASDASACASSDELVPCLYAIRPIIVRSRLRLTEQVLKMLRDRALGNRRRSRACIFHVDVLDYRCPARAACR